MVSLDRKMFSEDIIEDLCMKDNVPANNYEQIIKNMFRD